MVAPVDDPFHEDAILTACPDEIPEEERGLGDRPAPAEDTIGWEDGVWYDEAIDVNQSDGLDCKELTVVLSRTMARTEHIRGLEFESTPGIQVITREAYRERAVSRTVSEEDRAVQNAFYEALFMVDGETDAVRRGQETRGTTVAAFYSRSTETITMITPTDDPRQVQFDSALLAHELVHALQHQHFERVPLPDRTTDTSKGRLGLTEGDANYVQYRYSQRCVEEWDGDCLVRDRTVVVPPSQSAPTGQPNRGIRMINFQPYSDGESFHRVGTSMVIPSAPARTVPSNSVEAFASICSVSRYGSR